MEDLEQKLLELHSPSLEEVANSLNAALQVEFNEASADVADCPDLSQAPYHLAARGLNGKGRLVQAGGVPYLLPWPQPQRRYNLQQLLPAADCCGGAVLGAGAAPSDLVGKNAEFIVNFSSSVNNSRVAMVIDDANYDGRLENCRLIKTQSTELAILADVFCSLGQGGHVVRVRAHSWKVGARHRGQFTQILQYALNRTFMSSELPVGIGGVIRVNNSASRIHVMPDYCARALTTDAEVQQWLQFYDAPCSMTLTGSLLSHDPRNWGLRLEHFHGWCTSTENCGGHFHFDLSSDSVRYEAYFGLATKILRVQPPGGVNLFK